MSELKPCANCAGEATMQAPNMHRMTCIACKECGMSTGWGTVEEVTAAWNRRSKPANDPLTLEQLREAKDGAPLWMAYEDGAYGEWGLVCYNRDGFTVVGLREHHKPDDYGKTWLAYRRPPERSENDGL